MTATALPPGVITCLDDMLSAAECAEVLEELTYAWWWDSPLVQIGPGGALLSRRSYRRTSRTTSEEWMGERTVALLRRLEADLRRVVGLRPDHLEHWQAVRYRRGERFDEHHDAGFFFADPLGERTCSVVVYLDNQTSGGALYFPALRRRIQPKAGRVLAWRNLLPGDVPDPQMRHLACPARRAKTTLTVWERQRPTRNHAVTRR
jgi:hypothetical protein